MEIINSENLLNNGLIPVSSLDKTVSGCCSMVRSERTAGYIPSYDSFYDHSSSKSSVTTQDDDFDKLIQKLSLDESEMSRVTIESEEGRFDVFDLLDMINPLQHIPVVNYAYRYLTGDSIKPISSVIGGAVFAGPVGAASSLVASLVEEDSGKSLPEVFLFVASKERSAAYKNASVYADIRPVIDANYDFNV